MLLQRSDLETDILTLKWIYQAGVAPAYAETGSTVHPQIHTSAAVSELNI